MLKKRISKIFRSIIKLLLPFFFKILIKLKLNRRVINFLNEKSYFSNDSHNFSNLINAILKDKKLISLDVGAQGGFNSDNFFPVKYNKFFNCILVEPIKSEADKLERKNNIIDKALWSSKGKKVIYILGNRLGSSSMYKLDTEKLDLHDMNDKEIEKFKVTETVEVECDTLENSLKSLNINNLDYLKIDTQGAELEILKGIGEYRPLLIKIEAHIFSMYKDTPAWTKLVDRLNDLNYVLIDFKQIGKHKTRVPAEMDMLFINNFYNDTGKKKIIDNLEKFKALLLIFGQINTLKLILKKLKIDSTDINKYEDLY